MLLRWPWLKRRRCPGPVSADRRRLMNWLNVAVVVQGGMIVADRR
jgi:hypothetical protein